MTGPVNPQAAPEQARGGQYVTVPGFASPGQSMPSHSTTAPGSTVVYSPKGWRWEEAGDDYQKATAKIAGAAIEGAVRRMRTTFGQVFYIKGVAGDYPPFNGEAVGDTCRVQDALTLDIVAEWRWTGTAWERMKVTSEVISNLDVGKLTAGSANISEIAARKIASDVGRFLEITTDQLTVTGNASFVDLTAHHIWSRVINAQQGEFEQIKAGMLAANSVRADNIQVGALNGQVITGATIQTSDVANRGIHMTSGGLTAYDSSGRKTLQVDSSTGSIEISGRLGRRDTWSETYFTDIVWGRARSDLASGWRAGVGLAFGSNIGEWGDGAIYLVMSPSNIPNVRLQSPWSRRGSSSMSSFINVDPTEIRAEAYDLGAGSAPGVEVLTRTVHSVDVWKAKSVVRADNACFIMDNKTVCGVYNQQGRLHPTSSTTNGFYVDTRLAGMYYGNNRIWIDATGIHSTQNKKFTMRVPRMTRERGGLMLSHMCTESPYDGIEYWEQVEVGPDGVGRWELPDYVPIIASPKAPWVVFTGASGSSATLDRSDPDRWVVNVRGEAGTLVDVLVKGARMIDSGESDADGEPILEDHAGWSLWDLPPSDPSEGAENLGDVSPEGSEEIPDSMAPILGGGYYGPAPLQKEN